MTTPTYPPQAENMSHFYRLKSRFHFRDRSMRIIAEVRDGNMRNLFPQHLSDILGDRGTAVANYIDVVARDISEQAASALPTLTCASGQMKSEADKRRAETKNRIGDYYWRTANLNTEIYTALDRFVSFGFVPWFVEPNMAMGCPFIQQIDSLGSYYELDRFGNTTLFAHVVWKTVDELVALFPESAAVIRAPKQGGNNAQMGGNALLELVQWIDGTDVKMLLPSKNDYVLSSYAHRMPYCPVWIQRRPGVPRIPRGQFDDVVFVQLARAILAGLGLEAAHKSVNAPIAIPSDVQQLNIGPDAVILTDQPQNVRRVGIDLPPAAMQEGQALQEELRLGSRMPDSRLGQVDASVVTGQGLQELMAGYNTQLVGIQAATEHALRKITTMCFEMDEIWWPHLQKKINGTLSGRTFQVIYTPINDIAGNYECDVSYGFGAGLNRSQLMVMLLQLLQAGVISMDTVRENVSIPLDIERESRSVDVARLRDAIQQGLFAAASAAGPMVEQGMDPTLILTAAAQAAKARENGKPVEDAVLQAFQAMQQKQQEAAQQAAAEQQQQAAAQGGAGPGGPGGNPADQAPGGNPADQTAVGQAQNGPGGMPSIQEIISGMRGQGSQPVMQATTRSRVPIVAQG